MQQKNILLHRITLLSGVSVIEQLATRSGKREEKEIVSWLFYLENR